MKVVNTWSLEVRDLDVDDFGRGLWCFLDVRLKNIQWKFKKGFVRAGTAPRVGHVCSCKEFGVLPPAKFSQIFILGCGLFVKLSGFNYFEETFKQ